MADYLDDTGLHVDALEDRLAATKALLRAAISANLDLTPEQPTGQLVEILGENHQEILELIRAVYTAWDPDSSTGHSLTALALLTGTQRQSATKGTVTLRCNLNGATTLTGGVSTAAVSGDTTNRWVLLTSFTSPAGPAANYDLAFEAENAGAIQALAGTITVIATPTAGWNSVTNLADATEGQGEEGDPSLRLRREQELATGGSTTVDAIEAALSALEGMLEVVVYENDLDVAVSGIPPHAFEAVVHGTGAAVPTDADIAESIFEEKAGGIRAYGTTVQAHTDSQGNDHQIGFTRATELRIIVEVTIPAANRGPDYVGDAAVADAIEDWANGYTDADGNDIAGFFTVGLDVYRSEVSAVVVQLAGVENVSLVRLAIHPAGVAAVDLTVARDQIATIDSADVTVL